MTSSLYIKDLIVEATHGLHDHEQHTPQRFGVSVELTIDLDKASHSDNLDDSLDWSMLRDEIVAVVQGNSFQLMERLAQAIVEAMLQHERITAVTVTVDKLDAFASGIPGVRLTRQAHG
jgi:FolB domain-containing protein